MKPARETLFDEGTQESDSNSTKSQGSESDEDDLLGIRGKDLSKILSDEVCVQQY